MQDSVDLIEKAIDRHPVYWHSIPADKDAFDTPVFDALRAQGIRAKLLLDVADGRPYRLYRLQKDAVAGGPGRLGLSGTRR